MTCASCVARVEKKLNRLDGVRASVNLATASAHVAYDPALVSESTLVETVERTGYSASLPSADAQDAADHEEGARARDLGRRLALALPLTLAVLVLAMVPGVPRLPWLQLVDLPSVVATAPTGADAGAVTYPEEDRLARVPLANVEATRDMVRTGRVLANLLTANDTVDDELSRTAMLASSDDARRNPDLARGRASQTIDYVRSQMAQVRVEGPPFVMMSGESGPIQVTLVNDLEQPVRVGLQVATPGSNLRIDPVDPVTLGPGRRTSIRLKVASDDIGVHAVTLTATDSQGHPLGSQSQFSVRTSHVSTVIWVVMAIGGGLLLLAILVRLFRRVRRRRATHGPLLSRGTPPSDSGLPPQPGQELSA